MNETTLTEKDKYINLSNIASLASYSLLMGVTFALLHYHFYFQVLLHVPIFQFIDASELLLITAQAGIPWIFFIGAISLVNFLKRNNDFTVLQKWVFQLLILSLSILYLGINFLNDPIIREVIEWPSHYKYWYIYTFVLIVFVIAYVYPNPTGPIFFQKNKFILPLIITIWYALYGGWINYEVVTKSDHTNNIVIQTKSFGTIKTDSVIINAGRTKNYWFYYNRKTHVTRVIKIEDIEFTDFDADDK
jgi:hypothetical protein